MSIDELLQQAGQLPPDQQLQVVAQVVAFLIERIRQRYPTAKSRPSWHDIKGSAPYPLAGEDAQTWVSKTRQEGDKHQEQVWNS